jgi:hypothetical protein
MSSFSVTHVYVHAILTSVTMTHDASPHLVATINSCRLCVNQEKKVKGKGKKEPVTTNANL